jgi:hypothetical protein
MALSPNYGWAEPDNSSLVKNGAQDIRALGDAIDTSLWNVGFGQAGKNKIINGDFGVWQRGTSFSNPANGTFCADRFKTINDGTGATRTVSQQAFTVGAAPVSGYESQYFMRYAVTAAGSGNTYQGMQQFIEDVRTFAGQTVTFSFWAKADATRIVQVDLTQYFGSGGSGNVQTLFSNQTLTTSWARYSGTVTLPSISGKTIGTGSALQFGYYAPAATACTIDIWGVQLEYGSKATPFETATGTIQGELAACQRYFQSLNGSWGSYGATSSILPNYYRHQTQMRVTPTITITTAPSYTNASSIVNDENSVTGSRFYATVTSTGGGFATNFIYSASAEL